MSEPIVTFGKLLDPVSVDDFFSDYYDKKALHIPGSPDKVKSICSWESFNELLHRTAIWSDRSFKLVLDGKSLPVREYCEPAASRDGTRVMQPVPDRVSDYLGQGASIVLDLIETLTPGLRRAGEAIQMATASRVSCNAYCSQSGHQAFPSHFDTMDVFALHIEGAKTWRIYEGRFDGPMERPGYNHTSFSPDYHDKAKGDLDMEVELKPGDLLYLPKGVYHDALSSSENCLHLSYGTTQPTGLDFMRWVLDGLEDLPAFRKPMPPHDAAAELESHIGGLRDTLTEVLDTSDVRQQFRADQKRKAFSLLSSVAIPEPLERHRVRGRNVKVVRRGQEWKVTSADGQCDLGEGGEKLLEWILQRDHFETGELREAFPDVDAQAQIALLQSLSSIGVVEPL